MSDPLEPVAANFSATILDAIQREYPNDLRHRMDGPDDRPTPREAHPAFYGCYDWHSAVEMHWALARLLRHRPDQVPADARAVLDAHFTHEALTAEAAYLEARPAFSRPYGWGWVFTLTEELASWPDTDAQRWARSMTLPAEVLSDGLRRWLPLVDYPVRIGMHPNSAFALARAWRWSARVESLRDAIADAAHRWFMDDRDYPAAWEPSGADFLSPALTEAELMSMVLPDGEFAPWFERFPPRCRGRCSNPSRSATHPTDRSPTSTASTCTGPTGSASSRRRSAAAPNSTLPRPVIWRHPSTECAVTTTWSSTGWPPTPSSPSPAAEFDRELSSSEIGSHRTGIASIEAVLAG
jgi:hypothetical protein